MAENATRAKSHSWRSHSLEELQHIYTEDIQAEMRANGLDPETTYPTYSWLVDHGYRGLEDALRTQHNLTLCEFFTRVLEYEPRALSTGTYDWKISHKPTINELETYLERHQTRHGRSESTIKSKRARLAKYVRRYEDLHGNADLLNPAAGATLEEYETPKYAAQYRADQVFEALSEELSTIQSLRMYYSEINQFYKFLVRWDKAPFNPVKIIPKEFDLSTTQSDNVGLNATQVNEIYTAANTRANSLIVLALSGWGLRPNEVAALNTSQFNNLESGDTTTESEEWPYIEFGNERKNGPGTVTLLYGVDELRAYLQKHDIDIHESNTPIFPSTSSKSGHITTKTVENRFRQLAADAGVRVNGDIPTPKYGRRYWYVAYQEVMSEVYDQLSEVAAEQGSASTEVVYEKYLSEDARRNLRREYMQSRLKNAFDNTG